MRTQLQSATLSTTHLWFTMRTSTPLEIDAASGSALRGSLFNAIWWRFCTNKEAPSCAACPLHDLCPVSAIVAPLREENTRGQDIPRPYVIVPPLDAPGRYGAGELFSFGVTLIGTIVQYLPYILLSLPRLEASGLGHFLQENKGQRGLFRVETVEALHPFNATRETLYAEGRTQINASATSIQPEEWIRYTAQLDQARITLRFMTPLRLVDREHLVKQISFRAFIHRLLERYLALERHYGNPQMNITWEEKEAFLSLAEAVVCVDDQTTWVDVISHSNRRQRTTPIGGLLGEATFEGQLAPFLELLAIGELIHVGKNAVKGNGKYALVRSVAQV